MKRNLQPYPWQKQQWELLQNRRMQQKLPHALLLGGQQGVGKEQFSHAFVYGLFCLNRQQHSQACGQCRSCSLLNNNAHPDRLHIEPDENGKAIKINQIHAITDFLHKTALLGQYRVVIISQAEAMNHSAANALLKMLEEPGDGSMIVLISHYPSLLTATIRSRCQIMTFPAVNYEAAQPWLIKNIDAGDIDLRALFSLSRGSPLSMIKCLDGAQLQQRNTMLNHILTLLNQRSDPIAVAKEYLEVDLLTFFNDLSECLLDIIKFYFDMSERPFSQDHLKQMEQTSKSMNLYHLFQVIDQLNAYKHDIVQGIAFNKQLLLEGILCACQGQVIQDE